jgi:hypothetical protein
MDGRSCLLEWRCEQCQLSGTVSSTVLTLRSTLPSWATFVNFTFEAPPFVVASDSSSSSSSSSFSASSARPVPATDASGIGGAGTPFSTQSAIAPAPRAIRSRAGENAPAVAISLIGVVADTTRGSGVGGIGGGDSATSSGSGSGSGVDKAVAFSALAGAATVPAGSTVDSASFDFGSPFGFQIDFVIQRSPTVIVWYAREVRRISFLAGKFISHISWWSV